MPEIARNVMAFLTICTRCEAPSKVQGCFLMD